MSELVHNNKLLYILYYSINYYLLYYLFTINTIIIYYSIVCIVSINSIMYSKLYTSLSSKYCTIHTSSIYYIIITVCTIIIHIFNNVTNSFCFEPYSLTHSLSVVTFPKTERQTVSASLVYNIFMYCY